MAQDPSESVANIQKSIPTADFAASQQVTPIMGTRLSARTNEFLEIGKALAGLSPTLGAMATRESEEDREVAMQKGADLMRESQKTLKKMVADGDLSPAENPHEMVGAIGFKAQRDSTMFLGAIQDAYVTELENNPKFGEDTEAFQSFFSQHYTEHFAGLDPDLANDYHYRSSFAKAVDEPVSRLQLTHITKLGERRRKSVLKDSIDFALSGVVDILSHSDSVNMLDVDELTSMFTAKGMALPEEFDPEDEGAQTTLQNLLFNRMSEDTIAPIQALLDEAAAISSQWGKEVNEQVGIALVKIMGSTPYTGQAEQILSVLKAGPGSLVKDLPAVRAELTKQGAGIENRRASNLNARNDMVILEDIWGALLAPSEDGITPALDYSITDKLKDLKAQGLLTMPPADALRFLEMRVESIFFADEGVLPDHIPTGASDEKPDKAGLLASIGRRSNNELMGRVQTRINNLFGTVKSYALDNDRDGLQGLIDSEVTTIRLIEQKISEGDLTIFEGGSVAEKFFTWAFAAKRLRPGMGDLEAFALAKKHLGVSMTLPLEPITLTDAQLVGGSTRGVSYSGILSDIAEVFKEAPTGLAANITQNITFDEWEDVAGPSAQQALRDILFEAQVIRAEQETTKDDAVKKAFANWEEKTLVYGGRPVYTPAGWQDTFQKMGPDLNQAAIGRAVDRMVEEEYTAEWDLDLDQLIFKRERDMRAETSYEDWFSDNYPEEYAVILNNREKVSALGADRFRRVTVVSSLSRKASRYDEGIVQDRETNERFIVEVPLLAKTGAHYLGHKGVFSPSEPFAGYRDYKKEFSSSKAEVDLWLGEKVESGRISLRAKSADAPGVFYVIDTDNSDLPVKVFDPNAGIDGEYIPYTINAEDIVKNHKEFISVIKKGEIASARDLEEGMAKRIQKDEFDAATRKIEKDIHSGLRSRSAGRAWVDRFMGKRLPASLGGPETGVQEGQKPGVGGIPVGPTGETLRDVEDLNELNTTLKRRDRMREVMPDYLGNKPTHLFND